MWFECTILRFQWLDVYFRNKIKIEPNGRKKRQWTTKKEHELNGEYKMKWEKRERKREKNTHTKDLVYFLGWKCCLITASCLHTQLLPLPPCSSNMTMVRIPTSVLWILSERICTMWVRVIYIFLIWPIRDNISGVCVKSIRKEEHLLPKWLVSIGIFGWNLVWVFFLFFLENWIRLARMLFFFSLLVLIVKSFANFQELFNSNKRKSGSFHQDW